VIHHEDVLKEHYYFFDITLGPGKSQSVRLRFRTLQPGVFEGLVFVDVATDTNEFGLHTPAVPISISVSP
jgi:hypothetical protein